MQVVILCGGKATRLFPLTKKVPKSMVPILGKPFLEYQINLLKKNSLKNILLCTGYKGKMIKQYFGNGKKFGVRIKYSQEKKKLLGTAGALKNAQNLLENNFIVMYGDSYVDFDFNSAIKYFNRKKLLGLMTVYKNNNKIERSNVQIKNGLVVDYDKENYKSTMKYIDYGVSIFDKKILDLISKDKCTDLSYINKELIKRKELSAFIVKKRYYQIGNPKGLMEFQNYAQKFLTKKIKVVK